MCRIGKYPKPNFGNYSLLAFIFIVISCNKQKETIAPNHREQVKEVLTKEIQKILADTGIPSISIALVKNDSLIWAEAFGYSNIRTKTPATTTTAYATGSNVKPFMSVAILQLAAEEKLDLDRPVNDYLEHPLTPFSKDSKPITLRHLLSHQSGLPASSDFIPLWGRERRKDLEEIQSSLQAVREPESAYEYCNDGFVLAALALEKATGQYYEVYIIEHFLNPLGLRHLGFVKPRPETLETMAFPYKLAYNNAYPIPQYYAQPYPAGGMTYMAPSQMARFLIMLLNNGVYKGARILSEEQMLQLYRPSFGHEYYGLGIGVEQTKTDTLLFHSGLQPGYYATFKISLSSRTGVYIAANTTAEKPLSALADAALTLMQGNTSKKLPSFSAKEFQKISLSKEQLKPFLGSYTSEEGGYDLEIIMKDDALYLKNPKQQLFEIVPYDKNKFFLKTEEEQLEFLFEGTEVRQFILHANNTQTKAEKVKIQD